MESKNNSELLANVKEIFDGLVVITGTSKSLLESMREELTIRPDDPHIGKIFNEALVSFKVYSSYISGYDHRLETISKLKHNKRFLECLANIERSEQVLLKHRSLTDILIHPVKRMPQYEILLSQLIKYTPEDHPDYQNLKKAVQSCGSCNDTL